MARLSRTGAATQRPVPNSRRNVIVMPVIFTLLLRLSDKCAIVLSAGATAIGKVVAGSMPGKSASGRLSRHVEIIGEFALDA